MVIWLNADGGGMAIEGGILRRADAEQVVEAHTLRQSAEAQRDALLAQVRGDAEAIVAEARQEADRLLDAAAQRVTAEAQRGYAEGRLQAVTEWHERHAGQHLEQSQSLQTLDAKLADIVTAAVRRIIQTDQHEGLFERALASVQSLTRGSGTVKLRVSSADLDQARSALGRLAAESAGGLLVDVAADAALAPGACVFESDIGRLDASLDTQLEGLRSAMVRAVQKALADEDAEATDAAGPTAGDERHAQDDAAAEHG